MDVTQEQVEPAEVELDAGPATAASTRPQFGSPPWICRFY
jgi:hypothetical protein